MSKAREFWIIAHKGERMLQLFVETEKSRVPIGNSDKAIIHVIEKSAADKLADHLALAIAGLRGANVDIKFLENRLKDYRGTE